MNAALGLTEEILFKIVKRNHPAPVCHSDLKAAVRATAGACSSALSRLCARGLIYRMRRGVYALGEAQAVYLDEQRRLWRDQTAKRYRKGDGSWLRPEGARHAPPEVLAERDNRMGIELTSDQVLLGDPPPGRSALDKMRQQGKMP